MSFRRIFYEDLLSDLVGSFDVDVPKSRQKKTDSKLPRDYHIFRDMSWNDFERYVKKNIQVQKNKFELKYEVLVNIS